MQLEPSISLASSGNILVTFYTRHVAYDASVNDALVLNHSVEIPQTLNGMRLIKQILRARELGDVKFNQLGNPSQAIIDAWLKSKKEQEQQDLAEQEKRSLEDLMEMF